MRFLQRERRRLPQELEMDVCLSAVTETGSVDDTVKWIELLDFVLVYNLFTIFPSCSRIPATFLAPPIPSILRLVSFQVLSPTLHQACFRWRCGCSVLLPVPR